MRPCVIQTMPGCTRTPPAASLHSHNRQLASILSANRAFLVLTIYKIYKLLVVQQLEHIIELILAFCPTSTSLHKLKWRSVVCKSKHVPLLFINILFKFINAAKRYIELSFKKEAELVERPTRFDPAFSTPARVSRLQARVSSQAWITSWWQVPTARTVSSLLTTLQRMKSQNVQLDNHQTNPPRVQNVNSFKQGQ